MHLPPLKRMSLLNVLMDYVCPLAIVMSRRTLGRRIGESYTVRMKQEKDAIAKH
jgi:hypothetical protein